jgi:HlyD family secretion protein
MAMGMIGRIAKHWHELNRNFVATSGRASAKSGLSGGQLHARSRQGFGRYRTDRIGQVVAGAHAGRSLAAGARQRAARWRDARSMVLRSARPAYRLRAARCRIVQRYGGANICRFEDPPDPNAVIAAAQAAGVHDLIINLPEGYDTVIGDHGGALSAGQAQRIALARALYRDPFLVVLDEPNSNLDAEGDEALTRAILGLRARGAITVVIAHRPSAIAGVDYILVMAKSRQQQFGPKEEVLSRVVQPASAPRSLKVAEQGGRRLIAKLSADLYRLVGAITARARTIAAALPWGLGQAGPTTSASESIRRHILAGSILVGVLVIGLGGWASTAQISGALIAQGSIVVDTNVKKVQHPTGGVVGELFVRDGDHVKAGDILLRLDETVTRANLAIVNKGLIELYARKARLAAERDGADTMAVPAELANRQNEPEVKEAVGSERKLFDLRHQDRLGQKQQLQERITQLQQQISGLAAQQSAKDKGIALTEQELGGVRDLWQKNLVQLNRLTSLQRDEARLEGERGQIVAQSAEVKGKIAEIQLQIIQVDQDLSSDVAKEPRETDSKIGEYVERKVTAEDQLRRTDIRAPQDGIVFQSTANTVGGVIAAGDPIMIIVPESDNNLTVEVKVDPKDIDQVQFGQTVVLRFSSFNVRTTPEINGTVSRIAADTTTDQRTGQSYYLVRIGMPANELKSLGDVKLTPGMPVEAFIETGERTMMSYLIKPLHDQLMRAFREK